MKLKSHLHCLKTQQPVCCVACFSANIFITATKRVSQSPHGASANSVLANLTSSSEFFSQTRYPFQQAVCLSALRNSAEFVVHYTVSCRAKAVTLRLSRPTHHYGRCYAEALTTNCPDLKNFMAT